MQEFKDAGMKPLDLIWVDTDKSVDPTRKKIRSRLCEESTVKLTCLTTVKGQMTSFSEADLSQRECVGMMITRVQMRRQACDY